MRYGFGDDVVVFFIGSYRGSIGVAAALRRSGLAERAGSLVLRLTGNSTRAVIFGFLAAGAFLAMWITALGAVAIIMPLAYDIITEEGEEPGKSRFGAALMIASAWGPLIGALGTPAGSGSNPIAIRFLSEIAGYDLGFLGWMGFGLPAMILLLPAAWAVILLFFPPERPRLKKSREEIRTEAKSHAPATRDEKAVGIVFLFTIILWMVSPFISRLLGTKIPISMGALVAVVLLFAPGVLSYKWKDIEKDIDWSGILLIATGISLGTTLYKTGAAGWIATVILGGIGSLPVFWRITAVVFGVFSIKVVFSSNTLTGTITRAPRSCPRYKPRPRRPGHRPCRSPHLEPRSHPRYDKPRQRHPLHHGLLHNPRHGQSGHRPCSCRGLRYRRSRDSDRAARRE